jgi:hypothetical protein
MRRKAPWKKLAAELSEFGVDSVYLSRVRARVDPEQDLKALEEEIAGEIAQALGRTEERLNLALAELELCKARFDRAKDRARPHTELVELAGAFNAQRKVAEECLRHLVIHREAAGFRRNQLLYELFPIPPKLHVQEDAPS